MLRLLKLGSGKIFSNACPFLSIRDSGTTLPANGSWVNGSFTVIRLLAAFRDCEKSPFLSSCVGTVNCPIADEYRDGQYSSEKKKNNLFRSRLKFPGSGTGPPTLPAQV